MRTNETAKSNSSRRIVIVSTIVVVVMWLVFTLSARHSSVVEKIVVVGDASAATQILQQQKQKDESPPRVNSEQQQHAAVEAPSCQQSATTFCVRFILEKLDGESGKEGNVIFEVHEDWAPLGAARFKELVEQDFFTNVKFFRVLKPNFVAQFGISGNPEISRKWRSKIIQDDPVTQSNTRGTLSFATSGKNTRTTQLFINYGNNKFLDNMGFSPFAKIVEGMEFVDRIFDCKEAPNQGAIQNHGNEYLDREFPKLTYIKSAKIVSGRS